MQTARTLCMPVVAGALLAVLAGACDSQPSASEPTRQAAPAGQMTPRAFVPSFSSGGSSAATSTSQTSSAVQTGKRRILFIQGDHVPQSGYPHARVRDDGKQPESFTRLRTEVLENELNLGVDEFVLTQKNKIGAQALGKYVLVVLGSNARVLTADEIGALTSYFSNGGSVLAYADSQFGPNNWASDNSFLNQFGIEVLTDNYQPAVDISDIVATYPVMADVKAIRGEGISQFLVNAARLDVDQVLAKCSPSTRSGCILPPADQAKVQQGGAVACVVVLENSAGGRLAGVCDRNFFQNGPGPGSDLDQVDDHLFARNLFRWLTRQ